MKLVNIPLALLALITALFTLTAVGFSLSFIFDFELTTHGGAEVTHPEYVLVRTCAGVVLLGYLGGVSKLYDLFVFCLKFKGR